MTHPLTAARHLKLAEPLIASSYAPRDLRAAGEREGLAGELLRRGVDALDAILGR